MTNLFKIAFSLGLLLTSATAAAAIECLDVRAIRVSPCPAGRHWVPVRGICPKSYQIEELFCAADEAPECIDRRVAFYTPCPEGQERIFFQGRCERGYESEFSYCAVRP